jgi:hypothetical protein
VRQVNENLEAFGDDVVGLTAFNTGDESDAASVVFVARVV